jgi:hypothetical protein
MCQGFAVQNACRANERRLDVSSRQTHTSQLVLRRGNVNYFFFLAFFFFAFFAMV